jgi:polyhydroxybutyrate depolymerase
MVAYVSERVCVDPARVFAGGYSNGGYMTYRLGCEASDLVR